MLFNSIEFLIFLPICFCIYWSLSRNLKIQNFFILAASYFFYGCWDYKFLGLIILSSLTDFTIALLLERTDNRTKRIFYLLVSLFVNLGMLFVFKYYNFFIESFEQLFSSIGFDVNYKTLNLILPVGISFYTFQTLSYTIDVYRRDFKATKDLLKFMAYVSFFPQLVAGPIERATQLLPQFDIKRKFEYAAAKDGMRQILWGLFKKVVVADNCGVIVDAIYNSSTELSGVVLVIGAILFSFQVYCDFSGYSDIAIGVARLLGFDLMQNFAFPLFSRDIAEFWRRWHISLTTWFKDYLYIPLGGSRVPKLLQLRNVFAIFIVCGIWHGAHIKYIVYGAMNGLLYVPQIFFKTNRRFTNSIGDGGLFASPIELLRMSYNFVAVCICFIVFRADSLTLAWDYIISTAYKSISLKESLEYISIPQMDVLVVFGFILLMLIVEWLNRTLKHGLEKLPKSILLRYPIYLVLCLFTVEYFYGKQSFVYFQF